MPETFPTWDPETSALVETTYYGVEEIAAMLHVSVSAARAYIADLDWPHLTIARRVYMSDRDIGEAVESLRRGGVPVRDDDDGAALGWPVPVDPWAKPDADAESIR